MERLTIEYCGEYVPKDMCSIDRFGGADDCDLCCEYCKATEEGNEDCSGCAINQCFNKLGQYEDLEEQGKLLKLPCAVGDTVYVLEADEENFEHFHCGAKISEIEFDYWMIPLFEKCVFLTRQEAEAALEETKKGSAL